MTKMPHKAYKELCKRLRIEANIHWLEAEEIMQWKELLEEKQIEFKKRAKGFKERGKTKKIDQTKPSKALITKRQKLVEDAERVVKNQFDCEEERIIEEQERLERKEKQAFDEFSRGLSNEILSVWHKFHYLFYESFLPELYFIEIYCQLNDFGKKLFRELVELSLEDENAMFEDEYIKQLQCMERGRIKEVVVDSTLLDEIYEFWAFQYDVNDMQPIADITRSLLNFKREDWKCLVDYHRVLVLKKELLVEGRPFLDYLDKTLLFISNAPCLKACLTKNDNTNGE